MPGRRVAAAAVAAVSLAVLAGSASGRTQAFAAVVGGFQAPVYVTSAPGDARTLYVVEQAGRIKIVRNGAIAGTLLDIRSRVKSGGEQGLLSVAFHPQYAANGRYYVNYTDLRGDTRVVEFRRGRGTTGRQLLLVDQPYDNHNGGQLQFDSKGYLYVGMGDGGSAGDPENRAQNLRSRLGKLLRRNPTRAGSGWQIVGYGLRNPWRFSFDRKTGNLWIGDVGQGKIEEIDYRNAARIGRLANYGWPRYEGRATYDASRPFLRRGDLVQPVAQYTHSEGCSVTGGYVYRGSDVPSAQGRYYYGDFCSGKIWSFRAGNGRLSAPRAEGTIEGLSSFGEDGNGELYALSLSGGTLYKLR